MAEQIKTGSASPVIIDQLTGVKNGQASGKLPL
jgi:hypothetical protein